MFNPILNPKETKTLNTKANLKQFIDYVGTNQTHLVAKYLEKGLDPNFHSDVGETPLTIAVALEEPRDMIMNLYNGGSHLDFPSRDSLTPMHKAAQLGNDKSLNILLELGGFADVKDTKNLTPLFYAMMNASSFKCVELLLYNGSVISCKDDNNWQEVHYACKLGLSQHLDHLINYGADLNARNNSGNTPLHICAIHKQESCARILLFRGADKAIRNLSNQTAYESAMITGNQAIADSIDKHRANEKYAPPPPALSFSYLSIPQDYTDDTKSSPHKNKRTTDAQRKQQPRLRFAVRSSSPVVDPRTRSDFGALIAKKAAEKRAKFHEAKPSVNEVTFPADGSKVFTYAATTNGGTTSKVDQQPPQNDARTTPIIKSETYTNDFQGTTDAQRKQQPRLQFAIPRELERAIENRIKRANNFNLVEQTVIETTTTKTTAVPIVQNGGSPSAFVKQHPLIYENQVSYDANKRNLPREPPPPLPPTSSPPALNRNNQTRGTVEIPPPPPPPLPPLTTLNVVESNLPPPPSPTQLNNLNKIVHVNVATTKPVHKAANSLNKNLSSPSGSGGGPVVDPGTSSDFGALIAKKAAEKRAKFHEAKPSVNAVTFQADGSKVVTYAATANGSTTSNGDENHTNGSSNSLLTVSVQSTINGHTEPPKPSNYVKQNGINGTNNNIAATTKPSVNGNNNIMNNTKPLALTSELDFTQKKSKAMDYLIPKIDADYYELLKMLVEKMSRKYTEMELISYEGETQKVKLRGPGDRVDQIQLSLVNCISKLRSQKLTAIREECLKCSNLLRMLEAIATKRQLLFCKFKRFANGIYVTYFHECTVVDDAPTLRDIEDFDSYLSIYYTVTKIDFINHMHVLNTLKWTEFKANNLSNNQDITFDFIESKQLIIFGSKESVFAVECKIQQILSESNSMEKPMDLQLEDTLFLRYSACDVLTQLEKLHSNQKIKFEFNEMKETGKNNELDDFKRFELKLNNCNNSIYTDISSILKSECLRKSVKQIEVSGLPGLVKLLHKNNSGFRHALDQIRNDMKCSISYETVLYDYHYKPATTENADDNQRRFIGNSCLTIQKGNIVHAKADVIVNSCASSLKLNSGTLSRYILEAAGLKVQQECLVSHPNGITSDEIAITSAGEMKNCRKLYHVTCPSYNQNNKILEKVIMNCLNQLKKDKLKSIAIPAIGSGNLNYPADVVACALVETCSKFLQVNKDEKYELNIIIYENDRQVYKIIETFFKAPVVANTRETRVKRAQATFTIICNNDVTLLKVISTKLTDLIRSYIYKDKIDSDTAKNLKDEKLNGILQILSDIEITRDKSGVFHLHGYKDDIAVYKEKIRDLMITHVEDTNQLYQSFIKTSSRAIKDVQWEYNDKSDDKWTPFNLFINSTIEDAFAKKQSMASFLNEDGNEAIVYFDLEYCVIDDKNYSIRRVDCLNAQYKFPDNWVFQNSAADYELVTVDKRSTEFMLVMSEFLAKMQRFAAVIQIDRIQNKRLYQGYLLHRDYIKKKNNNCENEKILYHGTDEKNIVNIYKTGFNRSYCGVNGVSFGQGVYFALNSSYSNGYVKSSSGCKKMFRCRVLVGACTLGSSSMKVAPSKPNGDPYDSTGDSGGTVFVCYHDYQCYPEYLIHYN